MKDARGHGSNPGLHSQGVQATPKLQRRHFEQIAAELKSAPDAGSDAHRQRVSDMADKLATTNPGFRRDFFIKAASGGDYRFKGPGNKPDAVNRKVRKVMTPVQSENAPFKSRLGGHSYLDPHDPRGRK